MPFKKYCNKFVIDTLEDETKCLILREFLYRFEGVWKFSATFPQVEAQELAIQHAVSSKCFEQHCEIDLIPRHPSYGLLIMPYLTFLGVLTSAIRLFIIMWSHSIRNRWQGYLLKVPSSQLDFVLRI